MAPEQNSKAKKFKDDFWKSKNIKISIGDVVEKEGDIPESDTPMGPTPKPHVTDSKIVGYETT